MKKPAAVAVMGALALGLACASLAQAQGWSTDAKSGEFGTDHGANPGELFHPNGPPPGTGGWSSSASTFGTSHGANAGMPTVPSGAPGGGQMTTRGKTK